MKVDERISRWLVDRLMRRALQRGFRRVCWVGDLPSLAPGVPIILFANHHSFYDGYLIWLVVSDLLKRPPLLWMEDWDRFPFFAAVGALPFPPNDPERRAVTIRRTLHRLREAPETVLVYFPEGRLHSPEEGLATFAPQVFARLDRLLPEKQWWPVALHVTWRGDALPTAFLTAGELQPSVDGEEWQRLETLLRSLHSARCEDAHPLLEGPPGPANTWDFSFLTRYFSRYI